jgi:hypothetical protein
MAIPPFAHLKLLLPNVLDGLDIAPQRVPNSTVDICDADTNAYP